VLDFDHLSAACFLSKPIRSTRFGGSQPVQANLPTKFSTDRVDGGKTRVAAPAGFAACRAARAAGRGIADMAAALLKP
jgi:hypothetical protein